MRSASVRAWSALSLPPVLWFVQQQGIAGPLRVNCHMAEGWPAILWGIVSLFGCAVAGGCAVPVARAGGIDEGSAVPWIARIAILVALVFALAIALGAMAAAMVPACAR